MCAHISGNKCISPQLASSGPRSYNLGGSCPSWNSDGTLVVYRGALPIWVFELGGVGRLKTAGPSYADPARELLEKQLI